MKTHSYPLLRFALIAGLLFILVLIGLSTSVEDAGAAGECFYVWDVWSEDNSGITNTFEPGDWLYLYMQFDNECSAPGETVYGTLTWQVWDPDGILVVNTPYSNNFYYGTYQYYWEAQIDESDPKGEWTYHGSTSYYGGTVTLPHNFKIVPKAPTGVSATDGTYPDKVRVTWNASTGATSYKVYRATSSGGTYSQIGSPASTSFNDTTATPGTTYYYKVRGCVSVGCGGYSSYNSGWRSTGSGTEVSVNPTLIRNPSSITKGSSASGPNQWYMKVVPGTDGAAGTHFRFVVWLHVPQDWTLPWASQYSFTGDFSTTTLSQDSSAQSWVQNLSNCPYGGPAASGFKWRAFRGPQQSLPAAGSRLNNAVNLRGGLGVPVSETSDLYDGVRIVVGSYFDSDSNGTPDQYKCDHVAATNIAVP